MVAFIWKQNLATVIVLLRRSVYWKKGKNIQTLKLLPHEQVFLDKENLFTGWGLARVDAPPMFSCWGVLPSGASNDDQNKMAAVCWQLAVTISVIFVITFTFLVAFFKFPIPNNSKYRILLWWIKNAKNCTNEGREMCRWNWSLSDKFVWTCAKKENKTKVNIEFPRRFLASFPCWSSTRTRFHCWAVKPLVENCAAQLSARLVWPGEFKRIYPFTRAIFSLSRTNWQGNLADGV